jgi:DNA-binding transcriptional ArsR family regulator
MIRLSIDSAGLARSRFVVSPLHEAVGTLMPSGLSPRTGPDAWVSRARRILRRERLELLSALALEQAGSYLPDFLTPHPNGPAPAVTEQLEAVRATPPERVRAELEALQRGRPESGLMGRELPPTVQRLLRRGPRYVAQQAADELGRYWELAVAPHWADARAVLDAEVDRRALTLARHGASAMLNSLARQIRWADDRIELESRYEVELPAPMVLLMPSLVAREIVVLVDPVTGFARPPALMYPLVRPQAAQQPPGTALSQLLGPTRAGLLAALAQPSSTAALAVEHFLSPGTVSYHLGVLHRSGLVSRIRAGREVLYGRTPRGEELVAAQHGRPDSIPPRTRVRRHLRTE